MSAGDVSPRVAIKSAVRTLSLLAGPDSWESLQAGAPAREACIVQIQLLRAHEDDMGPFMVGLLDAIEGLLARVEK